MTAIAVTDRSQARARMVTDALEPRNWMLALVVALGWRADGLAGVGWGLLAGLFAAIFPVLFVRYGVRHWRWSGRHVGVKRERMAALAFVVGSDATGTATLAALRAPHAMTGYLAGMLATAVVITAITIAWKISVHSAVASAAIAMTAFAYGPAVLAGYLAVALVAWSRVALRDHTVAQAVAGVALGTVAAIVTCVLAR
jgi:hypothetical protein